LNEARERRIGYLCAIAVLFVWTGFLLTARLSAKQDFTPWDIAALRYAGAFVAALPFVAVVGLPLLPWRRLLALLVTAAFTFPLAAYAGFGFAPTAHGAVLMPGMLPFMTAALGAILLADAFSRRRAASLLVVACGIALLAFATFGDHPGAWRGDLLFLVASSSWSIYTVLVRRWRIAATPATLAIGLLAAPLYLPVWWFLLPSNIAAVPFGAVAFQFVYQGFFAVLVSGFLFTRAVVAIGAPRTTAITSLVPAMAALAAWPLLDEPLGVLGLAGIALVSAGMLLAVVDRRRA
jgi:drug/metabolite transporter (DMT)-like permease